MINELFFPHQTSWSLPLSLSIRRASRFIAPPSHCLSHRRFPKTGIPVIDCALTRQTDCHAASFRGSRATTEECEEVKENSGRP